MQKKLSISIVLLVMSSLMVYGQQITFQKNVNPKAKNLIQTLNSKKDSLLLECKDNRIQQVDIFSDDYSKRIAVNSNITQIDLKQLPIGKFVVQAKVDQKWIVMSIEKHGNADIASSNTKTLEFDYTQSSGRADLENSIENTPRYYWVVTESKSNFGSSKSMKLENKHDVAKIISKNKIELKSNIGRDKNLYIYAIYNKSQFMTKQLRNPDYYKSAEDSNFFNAVPYYSSNNDMPIESRP